MLIQLTDLNCTGGTELRRVLLLILMISVLLIGCDSETDEFSFAEVSIDEVDSDVTEFIDHVTIFKEENSNGIYIFNDSEKRQYLYLSQEFLDKRKSFGDVDIKAEEDSINIYLNDRIEEETETNNYKLYEINLDNKKYEYTRVFKNGEETYFQVSGL